MAASQRIGAAHRVYVLALATLTGSVTAGAVVIYEAIHHARRGPGGQIRSLHWPGGHLMLWLIALAAASYVLQQVSGTYISRAINFDGDLADVRKTGPGWSPSKARHLTRVYRRFDK